MAFFHYQARDLRGDMHRGVLDAPTELEVARKLKALRLYPVKIKPVRGRRSRSVPKELLIRFFYDLGDLLAAGLPLDRSLALIRSNQTHKVFQRVVQETLDAVQGGSDLSDALGNYRDIFGDLAGHMVRAGENSGTLAPILRRVAQYLEQRRTFRQNLISALVYPSILVVMSGISIVVLLVYVIPKFAQIFEDLHQAVPLLTRLLLQTGVFLTRFGWTVPVALLITFWGCRALYRRASVRRWADRLLLRLPVVKNLLLFTELTRFCRTLGTMLEAGVPMLRALTLVEQLILNTALQQALAPIHGEIKVGRSFSNFFRAREIFPPRMGTLLRIAEEQGNLGDSLVALGDYFEGELQRALQRIMTVLEPIIILTTGAAIGLMVMSMFSAIFGITEIQF
jgi:general secretion pathway protein F